MFSSIVYRLICRQVIPYFSFCPLNLKWGASATPRTSISGSLVYGSMYYNWWFSWSIAHTIFPSHSAKYLIGAFGLEDEEEEEADVVVYFDSFLMHTLYLFTMIILCFFIYFAIILVYKRSYSKISSPIPNRIKYAAFCSSVLYVVQNCCICYLCYFARANLVSSGSRPFPQYIFIVSAASYCSNSWLFWKTVISGHYLSVLIYIT
jgi:hypothetical protein